LLAGITAVRKFGDDLDVYSPEAVRDLRTALRSSWDLLCTYQSPLVSESRREETREMLARRLLKCAAAGETNTARLVTYAVGSVV
jgi:hypothetical protein